MRRKCQLDYMISWDINTGSQMLQATKQRSFMTLNLNFIHDLLHKRRKKERKEKTTAETI